MPHSNYSSERPPWSEDTEEALAMQEKYLRKLTRGHPPSAEMSKRIIRCTVRLAILALVLWLFCETVVS